MVIKCIGCYELLREEVELKGKPMVVYMCPRFFPYACVISGLLRPGKGIIEGVKLCPETPDEHCILCGKTDVTHYGREIVMCKEHDRAWGKWLDQHPERRARFSPKGRLRTPNWIEVFREFIEEMRPSVEGTP